MLAVLAVSREYTDFSNSPLKDCSTKMNDEGSGDERAKYIQQIIKFIQYEKGIKASDESSDESDADGNSSGRSPDRFLPEERRRSGNDHNSDVDVMVKVEDIKLRRFVDITEAETQLVETPVTCSAGPRSAGPRSAGQGLAGPRLAGPRLAGPRLAGPRLAGPRLAGPRLAGPRLAGPRLAEPRLAEPRLAEPRLAEPRLAEPRLAEPRLAEPRLAEPRLAEPNVPKRTAGPLMRRPQIICKLDLNKIDLSAILLKKNSRNSTPLGIVSAGVSVNADLLEETDDENYLLDEDKILHIFEAVDVSGEENSIRDEMAVRRQDDSRSLSASEISQTNFNKEIEEIQGTRNTIPKGMVCNLSANSRNLDGSRGPTVEPEKPSVANGSPKRSRIPLSVEHKSKSRLDLSKETSKQDSPVRADDESDIVSKKRNPLISSKSPKQTPEEKSKSENGPTNEKKLLKGPKSCQTNSEKKPSSGCSKRDTVKKPKKNLFKLKNFVLKSPKSVNRKALTMREAILARSQTKSSGLSLSATKKLPPEDAAKSENSEERDNSARAIIKETTEKACQSPQPPLLSPQASLLSPQASLLSPQAPLLSPQAPLLSPQNHKRPLLGNSKSNENVRPLSSKTSDSSPREESSPLSLKSNNKSSCPTKKLTIKGDNVSEKICNSYTRNELFSRPMRLERSDNIPNRNINRRNRVSSPLSDFATRRNIPPATPNVQSPNEETQEDRSEKALAELGPLNCEEPVYINWNHSNIPSVVNPEGMSLFKDLSPYRKDLGVNEAIVSQLETLYINWNHTSIPQDVTREPPQA